MNKQELITRIKCLDEPYLKEEFILDLIEQLDEPQKVKIPNFVAEWIEYCKAHDFTLFGCIDPANDFEDLADETFKGDIRKCIRWCRRESDIFARAWLDGYEVEKEKRYRVKMKGVNDSYCVLTHYEDGNRWIMGTITNNCISCKLHTKKQLEDAGFGWVFDCPGIEIEEVE